MTLLHLLIHFYNRIEKKHSFFRNCSDANAGNLKITAKLWRWSKKNQKVKQGEGKQCEEKTIKQSARSKEPPGRISFRKTDSQDCGSTLGDIKWVYVESIRWKVQERWRIRAKRKNEDQISSNDFELHPLCNISFTSSIILCVASSVILGIVVCSMIFRIKYKLYHCFQRKQKTNLTSWHLIANMQKAKCGWKRSSLSLKNLEVSNKLQSQNKFCCWSCHLPFPLFVLSVCVLLLFQEHRCTWRLCLASFTYFALGLTTHWHWFIPLYLCLLLQSALLSWLLYLAIHQRRWGQPEQCCNGICLF